VGEEGREEGGKLRGAGALLRDAPERRA